MGSSDLPARAHGAYRKLGIMGTGVGVVILSSVGASGADCHEERLLSESRQCLSAPADQLRRLAPGESASSKIDAQKPWNCIGVLLEHGASYEVTAADVKDWKDSKVQSDLEKGWLEYRFLAPVAQLLARSRHHPMYSLIGAIVPAAQPGTEPTEFFLLGKSYSFTPSEGGQLVTFANDWPNRYCNNSGTVEITIMRHN